MMALAFTADGDCLLRNSGTMPSGATVTVSLWLYYIASANGFPTLVYLGPNTVAATYLWLGINKSVSKLHLDVNGTTTLGPTVLAESTWYHVALVKSAANAHNVYLDGAALISDSTNIGTVTATRLQLGKDPAASDTSLRGRLASIKVWSAGLDSPEVVQERWTVRTHRRASLFSAYPCIDRVAGDNALDSSGSGFDMTPVGSLASADGPPISWGGPSRRIIGPFLPPSPLADVGPQRTRVR
jgi:hypothetical protein